LVWEGDVGDVGAIDIFEYMNEFAFMGRLMTLSLIIKLFHVIYRYDLK